MDFCSLSVISNMIFIGDFLNSQLAAVIFGTLISIGPYYWITELRKKQDNKKTNIKILKSLTQILRLIALNASSLSNGIKSELKRIKDFRFYKFLDNYDCDMYARELFRFEHKDAYSIHQKCLEIKSMIQHVNRVANLEICCDENMKRLVQDIENISSIAYSLAEKLEKYTMKTKKYLRSNCSQ